MDYDVIDQLMIIYSVSVS